MDLGLSDTPSAAKDAAKVEEAPVREDERKLRSGKTYPAAEAKQPEDKKASVTANGQEGNTSQDAGSSLLDFKTCAQTSPPPSDESAKANPGNKAVETERVVQTDKPDLTTVLLGVYELLKEIKNGKSAPTATEKKSSRINRSATDKVSRGSSANTSSTDSGGASAGSRGRRGPAAIDQKVEREAESRSDSEGYRSCEPRSGARVKFADGEPAYRKSDRTYDPYPLSERAGARDHREADESGNPDWRERDRRDYDPEWRERDRRGYVRDWRERNRVDHSPEWRERDRESHRRRRSPSEGRYSGSRFALRDGRNLFLELKFKGRDDRRNAVQFVDAFERTANFVRLPDADRLYYLGQSMTDCARDWFEVMDFTSYTRAVEGIIKYYWGEREQAQFREQMYSGTYARIPGTRMSDYVTVMTRKARCLEPPMGEFEIVRCLKRHFQGEINWEVHGHAATLELLCKMLDNVEDERENAKRREKPTAEKPKTYRKYETAKKYSEPGKSPSGQTSGDKESPPPIKPKTEPSKPRTPADKTMTAKREPYKKPYESRDGKPFREKSAERKDKGAKDGVASMRTEGLLREFVEFEEKEARDLTIMTRLDKPNNVRIDADVIAKGAYHKTRVLLDTGAQMSAVDKEFLRVIEQCAAKAGMIRAKDKLFPRIKIKFLKIRGAFDAKPALSKNKVQVTFALRNDSGEGRVFEHDFHEIDGLSEEMILGADFLAQHKLAIEFRDSGIAIFLPKGQNGGKPVKCPTGKQPGENAKNPKVEKTFVRPNGHVTFQVDGTKEATTEFANELKRICDRHQSLFDGELGRVKDYKHVIKMNDRKPRKARTYPIPRKYLDEVRRQIQEMESMGVIEKAPTQYVNPLVVVSKPNGKIRLCLDARSVNEKMQSDHSQPPPIDDILTKVEHSRIFTKLDLSQAYWQIEMARESRQFTGFLFENNSYVFKRLPFGIKTAGALFTRAIDAAFAKNPALRNKLIIYLDDVLIASATPEEHAADLEEVLRHLEESGFKLNREKCKFGTTTVDFLGHAITEHDVRMSEETKRNVREFATPRNKRQLQAFLGLANWDRKFIPKLSDLANPLEQLLKKDAKFVWTSDVNDAFEAIKLAFAKAKNLALIDPELEFGLDSDASNVGLGARLYQIGKNKGTETTIAYVSRSLKPAERNYTITELEGLALVWALRKWAILLMGRKIRVNTDHKALTFLQSCASSSQRIARWVAFLQEFDIQVKHVPGKKNTLADTLSRNPTRKAKKCPNGTSTRNQVIIRPIYVDANEGEDVAEWIDDIVNAQANELDLVHRAWIQDDNLETRYDLIRVKTVRDDTPDKIVIPDAIAWKLLKRIHEFLLHFGTDKCVAFAKRLFKINNVDEIARDVVASCWACIANKTYTRATRGEMYYDLPEKAGETVSLDLYGPLPKSRNGNKYMLVLMDQFTKYVRLFPIKDQKLETIIATMIRGYFRTERRKPETILTDNGGQFLTRKWRHFLSDNGITARRTAPYNPQSNPVERVMREINRVLRTYSQNDHQRWDRIVPRLERVMNETVHASTGIIPNDLEECFGRRMGNRLQIPEALQPSRQRRTPRYRLNLAEKARAKLKITAKNRKAQADKRGEARQFDEGSYVWVKIHRLSSAEQRQTKKLFSLFEGPYLIRKIIRPNAYVVIDSDGRQVGVYNIRQLRPHRPAKLCLPNVRTDLTSDEDSSNSNQGTPVTSESSEEAQQPRESSEEEDTSSAGRAVQPLTRQRRFRNLAEFFGPRGTVNNLLY